jgi:hypothetical protein
LAGGFVAFIVSSQKGDAVLVLPLEMPSTPMLIIGHARCRKQAPETCNTDKHQGSYYPFLFFHSFSP